MIAQRIRWSQGLQTATSQTAHGAGASHADVTLSDLLEYHCPKTGLTPLMAAVVKGHLAVARQVPFSSSQSAQVRSILRQHVQLRSFKLVTQAQLPMRCDAFVQHSATEQAITATILIL